VFYFTYNRETWNRWEELEEIDVVCVGNNIIAHLNNNIHKFGNTNYK